MGFCYTEFRSKRKETEKGGIYEKGNLYFAEQCLAYGNGACVWK